MCLVIIFSMLSCSTTKKINIQELRDDGKLYSIKNNSYFYILIDSNRNVHLVRTHFMNSDRVIWTEKLNLIR